MKLLFFAFSPFSLSLSKPSKSIQGTNNTTDVFPGFLKFPLSDSNKRWNIRENPLLILVYLHAILKDDNELLH